MTPFGWLYDRLERRYSKRALARVIVVLAVALLGSQALFVWYFGSVGLSFREMGYDDDERTVIIDEADHRSFERHFDPDREEGWCLYGSTNETHVRIDAVVHADAISKSSDRIQFTCVSETATQLAHGANFRLIGTVHSHPSKNRSRLSRFDAVTWGRTSPVVEVSGIYSENEGVQFFTLRSILDPLAKDVRETPERQ